MSPVFGKLFGRGKKEEESPKPAADQKPAESKDADVKRLDFTAERQRVQQEEARRRFLEKMQKQQGEIKEEDTPA